MGAKIQNIAGKRQPQPNQNFSLLIILLTKKHSLVYRSFFASDTLCFKFVCTFATISQTRE